MNDLVFPTPERGWAVGAEGTILTTADGGLNWSPQNSGTSGELQAASFLDENTGVVFGRNLWLRTTDGGMSWTKGSLSINASAVDFMNNEIGAAVGLAGEIFRTTNGGATWAPVHTCPCGALFDVHHVGDVLWAAGATGTLMRSADGGATWERLALELTEDIWGISFDGTGRGIAVGDGGLVLASFDNGQSWSRRIIPTNQRLRRVIFKGGDGVVVISDQNEIWRAADFNLRYWEGEQTNELNAFNGLATNGREIFTAGWRGQVFLLGKPFISKPKASIYR